MRIKENAVKGEMNHATISKLAPHQGTLLLEHINNNHETKTKWNRKGSMAEKEAAYIHSARGKGAFCYCLSANHIRVILQSSYPSGSGFPFITLCFGFLGFGTALKGSWNHSRVKTFNNDNIQPL